MARPRGPPNDPAAEAETGATIEANARAAVRAKAEAEEAAKTKAAAAAKAKAAAAKAEAKVAAKAQAEAKALGPFGCLQCLAKFTSTRWQERHRCGTLPPHPRSAPPRQPTTHIRPRAKPQVVTSSAACSAPPHS